MVGQETKMIQEALTEAAAALDHLRHNLECQERIAQAGQRIANSLAEGGRVFSCGNGGSMCDAMHFAEELTGRFRNDRKPYAAMAISDPSHLSCTANDYGYEDVFARFVEAHGRKGDVLLAISTSGRSPNVIKAAQKAKELGVFVVALTGRDNSRLKEFADIDICTPSHSSYADRVQELHIKCIHILIELCEKHLSAGEV